MTDDRYSFHAGTSALLISVPHDGREIPQDIRARMTREGVAMPDTDWHVAELYAFARDTGASMIVANYSRYVVDLNRPADDGSLYPGQLATGLCPLQTFEGRAIYRSGEIVDEHERAERVASYWQPYHRKITAELEALRERHGHALLWDAHSIPSRVPRLFDGELPILNIGTWDGRSCGSSREQAVFNVAKNSGYPCVLNGRFKGGYITRNYGSPAEDVHAMQLEIAQRAYMNEADRRYVPDLARGLQKALNAMLDAFTIRPV